jgi:hypothetical protein
MSRERFGAVVDPTARFPWLRSHKGYFLTALAAFASRAALTRREFGGIGDAIIFRVRRHASC